jgi:hypothetical protein
MASRYSPATSDHLKLFRHGPSPRKRYTTHAAPPNAKKALITLSERTTPTAIAVKIDQKVSGWNDMDMKEVLFLS